MAAAGTVAYRASKQQFLEQMLDQTAKVLGRMPTQEEWDRIATEFDGEATEYGLWEAGPEALSNLFMTKLLGPLGKNVFKGGLGTIAKRVGGLYGEEFATETATQMGQGAVESEVGLRESAPGAWEAFKEVAPTTFWQTTLMAGGKKAADFAANRMRSRAESTVDAGTDETPPADTPPTSSPIDDSAQEKEFREASGISGPLWDAPPAPMDEATWNREAAARGWDHMRTDVGTPQPQEGVASGISMALENGDNVDLLQPDNHFSAQQPKTKDVQPTLRPDSSPLYQEDMDRVLAMRDGRYAPNLEERATAALEQRKMPYQGPSSTPFMEASGFTPQGMLAPQVTPARPISLGIGFMQDRPTPSSSSVQTVPTQAQITNTQTAPARRHPWPRPRRWGCLHRIHWRRGPERRIPRAADADCAKQCAISCARPWIRSPPHGRHLFPMRPLCRPLRIRNTM